MKRGDVVTIAMSGDYGKPRPAIIVQTDGISTRHDSVIICPITSDVKATADFRLAIEPTTLNGLRVRSHIMADKPTAVRRARVGQRIGHLTIEDMTRVNIALTFVMGLAD